jgi:hypothetical protein
MHELRRLSNGFQQELRQALEDPSDQPATRRSVVTGAKPPPAGTNGQGDSQGNGSAAPPDATAPPEASKPENAAEPSEPNDAGDTREAGADPRA